MAERSGNAQLDGLIDQFLLRFEYYFGPNHSIWREWDPIDGSWDELREDGMDPFFHVDEMRSADQASGNCGLFAELFCQWLERHDLDAHVFDSTPDETGYADRSIPGHADHAVTCVIIDGFVYAIDFTASQYGYGEFPLVQRQSVEQDEPWQRQWPVRPQLQLLDVSANIPDVDDSTGHQHG